MPLLTRAHLPRLQVQEAQLLAFFVGVVKHHFVLPVGGFQEGIIMKVEAAVFAIERGKAHHFVAGSLVDPLGGGHGLLAAGFEAGLRLGAGAG